MTVEKSGTEMKVIALTVDHRIRSLWRMKMSDEPKLEGWQVNDWGQHEDLNFREFIRDLENESMIGCLDCGVKPHQFVSPVRMEVGECFSDLKYSIEMKVTECKEVAPRVFRCLVEEV
jgi:hypothetical protein